MAQPKMGHRLYISGGGSIHLCDMDPLSGAVTISAAAVGSGAFMAPSSDGQFLYALEGAGATAYRIAADGTLKHLNSVAAELSGFAHISTTGIATSGTAVCILAAYGGGGVSILKIYRDGSLAETAGPGSSFQHGPGSMVDPQRQTTSCAHSAFVDPTGGRAIVSDLGTDQLVSYTIDSRKGMLTPCQTPFDSTPGAGPRHLCFHPSGKWLYSINELDCTITALDYDKETGRIQLLESMSTLPEGYQNFEHGTGNAKNAAGGPASGPNSSGTLKGPKGNDPSRKHWDQTNTCSDIHCSPNGKWLYGSNRGHDSLVCFEIGADGRLSVQGWT